MLSIKACSNNDLYSCVSKTLQGSTNFIHLSTEQLIKIDGLLMQSSFLIRIFPTTHSAPSSMTVKWNLDIILLLILWQGRNQHSAAATCWLRWLYTRCQRTAESEGSTGSAMDYALDV